MNLPKHIEEKIERDFYPDFNGYFSKQSEYCDQRFLTADTKGIIKDYLKTFIAQILEEEKDRLVGEIEKIYPPTFIHEVTCGNGVMLRGVQREIDIARISIEESNRIDYIINLIKK